MGERDGWSYHVSQSLRERILETNGKSRGRPRVEGGEGAVVEVGGLPMEAETR